MKILFIGKILDEFLFDKYFKQNYKMAFAQQKMEGLILKGFSENISRNDLSVLSTRHIDRYPKHKKIVLKKEITEVNNFKLTYISFINLPVLKQLTSMFSKFSQIKKWIKQYKYEQKIIFVYATNPTDLIPALFLRVFNKNIKIVSYVSEIDKYRLWNTTSLCRRIKFGFYKFLSSILHDKLDGYVFVTEQMKGIINKKSKPYIVIEGMVESNIKVISEIKNKDIIYTGTLDKKYGVNTFINAFINSKSKYTLKIYGSGDFSESLHTIQKKYSNIVYGGVLKPNEVLDIQKKAAILINPRSSDYEFTKYSFPSKILEYMASGTPCMITELRGIPNEYFNYCISLGSGTEKEIIESLNNLEEISQDELNAIGEKALSFVSKEKNNIIQTRKILDFFKELYVEEVKK